jgi:hypothetical protein
LIHWLILDEMVENCVHFRFCSFRCPSNVMHIADHSEEVIVMQRSRFVGACAGLALLAGVAAPIEGHAAASGDAFGTFLGLFAGNDEASVIANILGLTSPPVALIGRVDPPADGTSGQLTLSNTDNGGGGTAASGDWQTSSPIGILVVKEGTTACTGACVGGGDYVGDGDAFAVYEYSGATSGNWTGEKFFTAGGVFKEISHISAYVVPLPAALPLMLTAIGGLFGFRWLRRRKEQDGMTVVAA